MPSGAHLQQQPEAAPGGEHAAALRQRPPQAQEHGLPGAVHCQAVQQQPRRQRHAGGVGKRGQRQVAQRGRQLGPARPGQRLCLHVQRVQSVQVAQRCQVCTQAAAGTSDAWPVRDPQGQQGTMHGWEARACCWPGQGGTAAQAAGVPRSMA